MTEHHFQTPEPVRLAVENGSGHVHVTAADTTESHVSISGRHAEEVEVVQDGRTIRVTPPHRRTGFFSGDDGLDMTITVPAGSEVAVKTGSADVELHGPVGTTQVKTGSGDVDVEHAAGDLQVKCGSGDVRLGQTDGSIAVSTGSGDVEVSRNLGPAVVKTGSGDVRFREATTEVSVMTGSGDLMIDTARHGRFHAKGASGSVHVGIPAGVPVWTDISTVSGRIHSDVEGAGEPVEGAEHIELRASTVSGDVVLTQR
ncbi:DUF4097 family beta strand repeat-containing protein [Nocardioides euryhalodurans]|uniref:DUF4097 domain-containing protein n=1 Tax=Nocardioides euryhalodurans TaxID=2518370 RepID=A0A4P7GMZ6_9ACTN|nr:DUF4097 family beta strand repeat-containing protein [Nocardioides euryhalodurans]QBR93161.1 hypothetical protein EXE57_13460 [Nocardioides euryhalodurans]